MRQTARLAVSATSSALLVACLLIWALPLASRTASSGVRNVSQAVVAYGYLRWGYLDLDKLFASNTDLVAVQDLKALDAALKSLDCDVPTRLASPHEAIILPSSPVSEWVGFPRPEGRNSPDNGWLFVTQSVRPAPQRVLVVFSSASPEHTTVFWLEEADTGYVAKLLYDSFKKGKISNATTVMGAATEVKIEKSGDVLLKDRGEPGVGPHEFARTGRVFRLDPSQETTALVSPGTRQH